MCNINISNRYDPCSRLRTMTSEEKFIKDHIEYHILYTKSLIPKAGEYFYDIPYDEVEVEKYYKILEAREQFNRNVIEIKNFADKIFAGKSRKTLQLDIIQEEITKKFMQVFSAEIANRPFLFKDHILNHPDIPEFIAGRNLPCEICGENRAIDKCHIIPARYGGVLSLENILLLCPTHHRLFDRGQLSLKEIKKIKFERKSKWASLYFWKANFPRHKIFNSEVSKNNFHYASLEDDWMSFVKIVYQIVCQRKNEYGDRKKVLETFCESSYPLASRCYRLISKGCPVEKMREYI